MPSTKNTSLMNTSTNMFPISKLNQVMDSGIKALASK
jgi:hypothetical protein